MAGSFTLGATGPMPIDEYNLKALFLYNFGKFVEWPPQAFQSSSDPIRVCVLGEDPFGRDLDDVLVGKTIGGRQMVAVRVTNASQAGNCHILFISSSLKTHNRAILAPLRTQNILTVGETDGFAEEGGVINLKVADGKIHLEIDVEAAERAKLRISAKLLNLARIVK